MSMEVMTDSILLSTKKLLGVDPVYTAFDLDILTHLNAAIATLAQLGAGPETGFVVTDETDTWSDYMGDDPRLELIKSYICLKTRLLFDPPVGSVNESFTTSLKELEWRILVLGDSMSMNEEVTS